MHATRACRRACNWSHPDCVLGRLTRHKQDCATVAQHSAIEVLLGDAKHVVEVAFLPEAALPRIHDAYVRRMASPTPLPPAQHVTATVAPPYLWSGCETVHRPEERQVTVKAQIKALLHVEKGQAKQGASQARALRWSRWTSHRLKWLSTCSSMAPSWSSEIFSFMRCRTLALIFWCSCDRLILYCRLIS